MVADIVFNQLLSNGNDDLVVQEFVADVKGGRTLDLSSYEGNIVKAGHIIIRDKTTHKYKPLGVQSENYKAISTESNCEFVGVLGYSISKTAPFATIVTMGQVCEKACPYPITDEIKKGLPTIKFI